VNVSSGTDLPELSRIKGRLTVVVVVDILHVFIQRRLAIQHGKIKIQERQAVILCAGSYAIDRIEKIRNRQDGGEMQCNSESAENSYISWAICKSAPHSRKTTTPTPHRSKFLQAGCSS